MPRGGQFSRAVDKRPAPQAPGLPQAHLRDLRATVALTARIRQTMTENSSPRPSPAQPPLRRGPLYLHVAVATVLITIFAILVAITPPGAGANIGAGMIGLLVLGLGLPWSIPALAVPYAFDAVPMAIWYLVFFGPALLNVALHAVIRYLRRHRPPRDGSVWG